MIVIRNFFSSEEVSLLAEYAQSAHFHTKEDHPPLHDNLYSQDSINFDIRTRGEFPDEVLKVFSEYSRRLFEYISELHSDIEYLPPMFSKYYIARYRPGAFEPPQTDKDKPSGTYVAYVYWNADFSGGQMVSVDSIGGTEEVVDINPGDVVIFEEGNYSEMRSIRPITEGSLYLSQAWLGPKGKAWFSNVNYDTTIWDSWEIRGF